MKISYLLAATLLVAAVNPAFSQSAEKSPVSSTRKIDLDLMKAVNAGNLAKVTELIDQGANPNAFDGRPLDNAITLSNTPMARLLVEKGATISFEQFKESLRTWSRKAEGESVAEALLDAGVDVNQLGSSSDAVRHQKEKVNANDLVTPLVVSLGSSNSGPKDNPRMEMLIARGANVNQVLPNGRTALDIAINSLDFTDVRILLEHGANPPKQKQIQMLLKGTFEQGDQSAFATLKKFNLVPNRLSFEQLGFPTSPWAIKTILEAGGNANDKAGGFQEGWTMLHQAARSGEIESVRLLLDAGAKKEATANYSNYRDPSEGIKQATPAFFAVQSIKTLDLLLARGANPNAVETYNGFSLLMWASIYGEGNSKAIASLIKAGAKTTKVDKQGQTALHLAATNDKAESVKALLKANHTRAFVEARDKQGRTALLRAVAPLASKLTVDRSQMPDNVKDYGVYLPTIAALVKAGADIKTKDSSGATVLHYAVKEDSEFCFEKLKYFMQRGYKTIDSQNNRGETPLYIACEAGNFEGATFLLDVGAKLDARAKNGMTPRKLITQVMRSPRPKAKNANEKRDMELIYSALDAGRNQRRKEILEYANQRAASKKKR